MKKIISFTILATMALLCLPSCQKMKESPHTDSVVIYSVIPELDAAGGSLKVTVYATTDWTAQGQDWLTVEPSSGEKGISETVLQFSANTTGAPRTAGITLKAGSYTHTQTVTQSK